MRLLESSLTEGLSAPPSISEYVFVKAKETAEALGREGIYVWDGHCYAYEPVRQLGLLESGGLVRVGLSIYNSKEEVERFLTVLNKLVRKPVGLKGETR